MTNKKHETEVAEKAPLKCSNKQQSQSQSQQKWKPNSSTKQFAKSTISEVWNSILFSNRPHWIDSTSCTWLLKSMGQIKQWMFHQIPQRKRFCNWQTDRRAGMFWCVAAADSIGKITETKHNKWALYFSWCANLVFSNVRYHLYTHTAYNLWCEDKYVCNKNIAKPTLECRISVSYQPPISQIKCKRSK